MSLFSFQGKILLGERLGNGKPGAMTWVGNAPACTVKLSTESTDKTESFSGNRLQYGRLQKGKTAEIDLTLDEWTLKNIALGLYGTVLSVVSGTVTGEVLPPGLVADDIVKLDKSFISALIITDSTATPVTLPTEKYSLDSANAGTVKFRDVGSYTQPFKAAYSYAKADNVTLFTAQPPERYLLLDGTNTETGEPVIMRLYRVRFDPLGELGLIHDDYGDMKLSGSMLYDPTNAADSALGGFGRIEQKGV